MLPPPFTAAHSTSLHTMTIVDYNAGTVKDMGLAQAKVVTMDDKTTMEITLNPGFDWVKEVRIYLSIGRQKKQIADLGSPRLLPIGVPQAPRLPRVVPRQPFRLPPGRHNEGPVQGRLHRDGQRRLQLQHSPGCVRVKKSYLRSQTLETEYSVPPSSSLAQATSPRSSATSLA